MATSTVDYWSMHKYVQVHIDDPPTLNQVLFYYYVTHMIGPLGRCLVEEMWYSINVLFWRLKDFCCCCSRYCLPRTSLLENWRPGTACISIWPPKFLCIWIHCSPWSNLTQEIQFLEFTGGSNSTHAHSNYLICMHFIINTACTILSSSALVLGY